ncbi:MAG: hypothetical protein K9L61_06040, partial [Candidatus Omnitrophica bacterium]|nr:hypothetical protein [Candidatus Omnitrophota bacterium]
EKLDDPKHNQDLELSITGIFELEKNRNYIRFERSSLGSGRYTELIKGKQTKKMYNKLESCTFYIFKDFVCGIGDSNAIKDTRIFLSEIMLLDIPILVPTEINMRNVVDRFDRIEKVSVERIKHPNINKATLTGKGADIGDLADYIDYGVKFVQGLIKFDDEERKIKIGNNGVINFYKMKEKPLYVSHIEAGYRFFC